MGKKKKNKKIISADQVFSGVGYYEMDPNFNKYKKHAKKVMELYNNPETRDQVVILNPGYHHAHYLKHLKREHYHQMQEICEDGESNMKKIKRIYREVLKPLGFVHIDKVIDFVGGIGTNRFVVYHEDFPNVVYKVALDQEGIEDNYLDLSHTGVFERVPEVYINSFDDRVSVQRKYVPCDNIEDLEPFIPHILETLEKLSHEFLICDMSPYENYKNYGFFNEKKKDWLFLDASDMVPLYNYKGYELDLTCKRVKAVKNSKGEFKVQVCGGKYNYVNNFHEAQCDKCGYLTYPSICKPIWEGYNSEKDGWEHYKKKHLFEKRYQWYKERGLLDEFLEGNRKAEEKKKELFNKVSDEDKGKFKIKPSKDGDSLEITFSDKFMEKVNRLKEKRGKDTSIEESNKLIVDRSKVMQKINQEQPVQKKPKDGVGILSKGHPNHIGSFKSHIDARYERLTGISPTEKSSENKDESKLGILMKGHPNHIGDFATYIRKRWNRINGILDSEEAENQEPMNRFRTVDEPIIEYEDGWKLSKAKEDVDDDDFEPNDDMLDQYELPPKDDESDDDEESDEEDDDFYDDDEDADEEESFLDVVEREMKKNEEEHSDMITQETTEDGYKIFRNADDNMIKVIDPDGNELEVEEYIKLSLEKLRLEIEVEEDDEDDDFSDDEQYDGDNDFDDESDEEEVDFSEVDEEVDEDEDDNDASNEKEEEVADIYEEDDDEESEDSEDEDESSIQEEELHDGSFEEINAKMETEKAIDIFKEKFPEKNVDDYNIYQLDGKLVVRRALNSMNEPISKKLVKIPFQLRSTTPEGRSLKDVTAISMVVTGGSLKVYNLLHKGALPFAYSQEDYDMIYNNLDTFKTNHFLAGADDMVQYNLDEVNARTVKNLSNSEFRFLDMSTIEIVIENDELSDMVTNSDDYGLFIYDKRKGGNYGFEVTFSDLDYCMSSEYWEDN